MRTAILSFVLLVSALVLPAQAQAPLSLTDMEGTDHQVAEILDSGHNVVLVFWQTWCASCRREAPGLVAAAREHREDLSFFGVVSGSDRDIDERKVRRYIDKYELPYPQIRDRDLALVERYEVKSTPTIVVLGPGHEILYQGHHPPEDWAAFAGKASAP